jgi:hypothetical protein
VLVFRNDCHRKFVQTQFARPTRLLDVTAITAVEHKTAIRRWCCLPAETTVVHFSRIGFTSSKLMLAQDAEDHTSATFLIRPRNFRHMRR